MIAIIDYGMGNLRSVGKALEKIGETVAITSDAAQLDRAEKIILPGVGAVGDARANLEKAGLLDPIYRAVETGKPFLGICLGFQLLFDSSQENGGVAGLGIIPGRVVRFEPSHRLPVPHIGWNQLRFPKNRTPIFDGIAEGAFVYFVHSYYAVCDRNEDIAATTDYGIDYCSAVARGNLFGTQFHPEKSQSVGLAILKNFAALR